MNTNTVRTYLAIVIITLGGLYAIDYAHIAYPLEITTTTRSTELAVVGEGKVEVVPDTATVNLGIAVSRVSTVEDAQNQIDEVNNKILSELRSLGVDEKDIKTSSYSINPHYSYEERTQKIDGYDGSASVTVKTKDVDLVTQIVSRATAAGANRVNGVNFSVDDPAKFREEARSKAIENAKEEAKKLANELGISLGKVTNVVESSTGAPYPIYRADAMEAMPVVGGGPEIEPGSQEITSTVTLYFEKR